MTLTYLLISFDSSLKTRGLWALGTSNYTKLVFPEITCDKCQRAPSSEFAPFPGVWSCLRNRFMAVEPRLQTEPENLFFAGITLCRAMGLTRNRNGCSRWTRNNNAFWLNSVKQYRWYLKHFLQQPPLHFFEEQQRSGEQRLLSPIWSFSFCFAAPLISSPARDH